MGTKGTFTKRLTGTCKTCGKKFPYYEGNSKGIYCSRQCAGQRLKGAKNPNWIGGPATIKCAYCGNPKKIYLSVRPYKLHFCNMDCYRNWKKKNLVGEANPNWRGGRSFEPYPTDWTEQLREAIRERDGRICVFCGKTEAENGEKLCVHHIDYDKENHSSANLISLCHNCHSESGFSRNEWQRKLAINFGRQVI